MSHDVFPAVWENDDARGADERAGSDPGIDAAAHEALGGSPARPGEGRAARAEEDLRAPGHSQHPMVPHGSVDLRLGARSLPLTL